MVPVDGSKNKFVARGRYYCANARNVNTASAWNPRLHGKPVYNLYVISFFRLKQCLIIIEIFLLFAQRKKRGKVLLKAGFEPVTFD